MPNGEVHTLAVILSIWRQALLGTMLLLLATVAGSALAKETAGPPVRLVRWWVRRVVLPLVASRSWWRRFLTIAANNTVVLVAVVCLGRWPLAPIVGVAAVGLSLGIGLRLLSGWAIEWPQEADGAPITWRVRLGMAVNMLEPPVIMLAIGLSMGRRPLALSTEQVWWSLALWGLPALWVAAAGEALWLAAVRFDTSCDQPDDPSNHVPRIDP